MRGFHLAGLPHLEQSSIDVSEPCSEWPPKEYSEDYDIPRKRQPPLTSEQGNFELDI